MLYVYAQEELNLKTLLNLFLVPNSQIFKFGIFTV